VAKKDSEIVELKAAGLPADLDLALLQGDSGLGVSNMDAADVALPYLAILQSKSPQAEEGNQAQLPGAMASMFFNTVSKRFYPARDGKAPGLLFVPCAYERKYVEWVDKESGGGWVAEYGLDSDIKVKCHLDDKKKLRTPAGNLLIETAYHYGLYQEPDTGAWVQSVLPLKVTGLKINRSWNNELTTALIPGTSLQAPRWLFYYRLTTWLETKKTFNWWQLKVQRVEESGKPSVVSSAIYHKAKAFYLMVEAGDVKRSIERDLPVEDESHAVSNGRPDAAASNSIDDDIPF
jgi:hypothetical protein